MGGAYGLTPYGYGNVTSTAEFNIYVDPEAGLDTSTDPKATLTRDLWQQSGYVAARLAARITVITTGKAFLSEFS